MTHAHVVAERNIKDAAVKSKGEGYDKGNIRKRLETFFAISYPLGKRHT